MRSKEVKNPRVLLAISGSGSTAAAVLDSKLSHGLEGVDIVGVMASNNKKDTGKAFRKKLPNYTFLKNSEVETISPYDFKNSDGTNNRELYGEAILQYMDELGADSIAQLGFIPLMPHSVVDNAAWVINQHPGPLDPGRIDSVTKEQLDFGGKGMRGSAVTVARLAYMWATGREYWTESTVHFVTPDEEHDKGKLVSVKRLDIPWATPSVSGWSHPPTIGEIWSFHQSELRHEAKDVQDALLPVEHENVVKAISMFAFGQRPEGFTREHPLIDPGQGREYILFRAKDLGRKMAPKGDLLFAV